LQTFVDIAGFIGAAAFALCVTVFPILAIFKRTRRAAGVGFLVSSYAFGLVIWALSVLIVLDYWGTLAVIIGIFIFGIGVLPMALVIIVWNHLWMFFEPLFWWGLPLILSRMIGAILLG
jgi:hypothetical protein